MIRLNGTDAMLLYSETPTMPTHTLKIAVIDGTDRDGEFDVELIRRTLQRRLHLLDPLRYRLIEVPWRLHHPMWLQNCEVDFDFHVRPVQIPAPGGRRELDGIIGQIASVPLDRRRPLWEFFFAEGLAGQRYALIGKIHHALADGVASANLLALVMDSGDSAPLERDNATDCVAPSTAQLLQAAARDHVRQLLDLPALLKDAIVAAQRLYRRSRERGQRSENFAKPLSTPPTFLNHSVSAQRTFATATLSLAEVKQTSKHLDATVNDLVLAMASGALRELLLRYDGRADQAIVASVPASTDKSTDRISGNELSGMAVSLPVHIDDPLQRLELVSQSTTIAKENYELVGPELFGRLMSYLPAAAAPAAFRWLAARDAHNKLYNIPISNVAGPRQSGRFAGAPVSEIYSAGPLTPGCAINITVWSYVDQLNISVIADDQSLTDTHQATDAMVQAFRELRRAAGLRDDLAEVPTAMPPVQAV
jgi:diacylglycerol O-acyltransferase / wax synthase